MMNTHRVHDHISEGDHSRRGPHDLQVIGLRLFLELSCKMCTPAFDVRSQHFQKFVPLHKHSSITAGIALHEHTLHLQHQFPS
jgi:predicted solute-binding protein